MNRSFQIQTLSRLFRPFVCARGCHAFVSIFFFGAILLKPVPALYGATADAREIAPGDFQGIAVDIPARVTYEVGSPTQVVIRGDEATRERVEATVSRGTLRLRMERQGWFRRFVASKGSIEVTVISPKLNTVTVSGSGRFVADSPLRGERVSATVSGSGRIEGTVEAQSVSATVSGSGRVQLTGTAPESVDVRISGSGRGDLGAIETKRVTARISGSGWAEVWATESLNASISGSGRVTYRGTPEVDSRVSGSGSVGAAD